MRCVAWCSALSGVALARLPDMYPSVVRDSLRGETLHERRRFTWRIPVHFLRSRDGLFRLEPPRCAPWPCSHFFRADCAWGGGEPHCVFLFTQAFSLDTLFTRILEAAQLLASLGEVRDMHG